METTSHEYKGSERIPIQRSERSIMTFFHTLPKNIPASFSWKPQATNIGSNTVPDQSPLTPVLGLARPPYIEVFVMDPQFGLGEAISSSNR